MEQGTGALPISISRHPPSFTHEPKPFARGWGLAADPKDPGEDLREDLRELSTSSATSQPLQGPCFHGLGVCKLLLSTSVIFFFLYIDTQEGCEWQELQSCPSNSSKNSTQAGESSPGHTHTPLERGKHRCCWSRSPPFPVVMGSLTSGPVGESAAREMPLFVLVSSPMRAH